MPENQAVLFWGLILGVLRILLFQGRAESPMERVAQGKRSGTLGWVIVSKTIYALKGQKRGYCAFVSHTQCFYVFTLLPFQGVDIIFLFHIPRASLRLPWAKRSIGLSARPGVPLRFPLGTYGNVAQEIQFSGFYRTAIVWICFVRIMVLFCFR